MPTMLDSPTTDVYPYHREDHPRLFGCSMGREAESWYGCFAIKTISAGKYYDVMRREDEIRISITSSLPPIDSGRFSYNLRQKQFNISDGNFLTSNFQVIVSSRNPNDKIGIYYNRLDVYATYSNQ
uniref:Uncharacterized protein n=1 Tax=Nelumbo nucifera TaxID=4432 RepID=A0A822YDK2_NELNU|nr:TPA_asm: hypothetical protein HUJ06_031069 [Nelumbo nucifera]